MSFHLITWNSQGKNLGAYETRLRTQPDIMVVQEAGNLPPDMMGMDDDDDELYKLGNAICLGEVQGYTCWWYGWTRQDEPGVAYGARAGNLRCSMAMFYKKEYHRMKPDIVEAEFRVGDDPRKRKRPLMIARLNSYFVTNIHAGGMDYVEAAIRRTDFEAKWQEFPKPWVVAGDFNQSPEDVKQRLAGAKAMPENINVIAPNKPTRRGRVLDYAVSSREGTANDEVYLISRDEPERVEGRPTTRSERRVRLGGMTDNGGSDHISVRICIDPDTRSPKRKREAAEDDDRAGKRPRVPA